MHTNAFVAPEPCPLSRTAPHLGLIDFAITLSTLCSLAAIAISGLACSRSARSQVHSDDRGARIAHFATVHLSSMTGSGAAEWGVSVARMKTPLPLPRYSIISSALIPAAPAPRFRSAHPPDGSGLISWLYPPADAGMLHTSRVASARWNSRP